MKRAEVQEHVQDFISPIILSLGNTRQYEAIKYVYKEIYIHVMGQTDEQTDRQTNRLTFYKGKRGYGERRKKWEGTEFLYISFYSAAL